MFIPKYWCFECFLLQFPSSLSNLGAISEKQEVLRKKHVLSVLDPHLPPNKRTLLWKPPDGFHFFWYIPSYWVIHWILLRLYRYLWLLMIGTKEKNHYIQHQNWIILIFWIVLILSVLVVKAVCISWVGTIYDSFKLHLLKWTNKK